MIKKIFDYIAKKFDKFIKTFDKVAVVSFFDFLGVLGFFIAWFQLPPTGFIVICVCLSLYYIVRALVEKNKVRKIIFGFICLACAVLAIYVLYDQSTLSRIEAYSTKGKQYYTNDELLLSDFTVTAIKKNGQEEQVNTFEYSPSTLQKGNNIIKIKYKEYETTVRIDAIDPYIEYLEITAVKPMFYVGDKISKSDFNVVGVDSKGFRNVLHDYRISTDEILSEGDNTFILYYETATGTVTVNAKRHEIVSIEAEFLGTEVLYEGDNISLSDIKVVGRYDNDVIEEILDFSISNTKLELGVNKIVVKYGSLSCDLLLKAHGIVSIEATLEGNLFFEGDYLSQSDFIVEGVYDNKERERLDDFEIVSEELIAGDNNVRIAYGNLTTDVIVYAYEALSTSVKINDQFGTWEISTWDPVLDFDISGKRHDNSGKKIKVTDSWHIIDPIHTGTSDLTMTMFVPLNPKNEEAMFSGVIVLDYSMRESSSSGEIEIRAGNEVLFNTGLLSSDKKTEIPFEVNISGRDSIEIVTKCSVKDAGFVYGLLNK